MAYLIRQCSAGSRWPRPINYYYYLHHNLCFVLLNRTQAGTKLMYAFKCIIVWRDYCARRHAFQNIYTRPVPTQSRRPVPTTNRCLVKCKITKTLIVRITGFSKKIYDGSNRFLRSTLSWRRSESAVPWCGAPAKGRRRIFSRRRHQIRRKPYRWWCPPTCIIIKNNLFVIRHRNQYHNCTANV